MKVERLFDFIYEQQERFPQEKCVGARSAGGWSYINTSEVITKVHRLAQGLIEMGIQPGDRIGLVVVQNRPEWLISDLAIQQCGGIAVPVYPTISTAEYTYIFQESGITLCLCDGGEMADKMEKIRRDIPSLKKVITFDRQEPFVFWEDLLTDDHIEERERRIAAIHKEDLATIIYTSGTTGHPKGVMLSHWNICSNVLAAKDLLPTRPGDRVLSFLPLCHIFEKVVTYAYLGTGMSITYTGLDNLGGEGGDLQSVRPHFFTAVPRLLEKVYDRIMQKGMALKGVKHRLFFWALGLTEDFAFDKKYTGWSAVSRRLADRLIFSKWRAALGGHVRGILTGAAACPENIIRTFSAAGIPVREGYGLTEASPGITFNRYDAGGAMLGTVGLPVAGVEVRIDETGGEFRPGEGEILAAGPNIMLGYYRQPEKTAEVLREIEGRTWLCTGDVGAFVKGPGGKLFLKITDRKKELLKTSGGKYIAPAPIEILFKQDLLIENIMVIGEQRRFVSALIVPAADVLRVWCQENGVLWSTIDDVLRHPKVTALYQGVADKYNSGLSKFEQVKRFTLIDAPWEVVKTDGGAGELTPTLKLKRRVILERWKDDIEAMYAE